MGGLESGGEVVVLGIFIIIFARWQPPLYIWLEKWC